jgi:uncharacterized membrane protein YgcG
MKHTRALLTVGAMAATIVAAGACTEHQTEVIVRVVTEGVRIPDDVRALHVSVIDKAHAGDDEVWFQDVALCTPTLTTSCYDLPVSAVLFPGKAQGSDTVRVQVDAKGASGTVISDAALFTFADKQSLQLDFVLYANCLNTECAKRDQACGPTGDCVDLKPGPVGAAGDMALAPSTDMAGCGHLSSPCCHAASRPAPKQITPNVLPDAGGTLMPDMAIDLSSPDMAMLPPFPDMATLPPFPDMAMGGGGAGGGGGTGGTGGTGGGGGGGTSVGTCDPGLMCVGDVCLP